MITRDTPEAYGYTIFCDDIRAEVGGKITFVGMYPEAIVIHTPFPALLPKFGMFFTYMQRRETAIAPTKLIIVMPGSTEDEPSLTIDLPAESFANELEKVAKATAAQQADKPFMTLTGPLLLTNVVLKEPGLIRVRAVRGDELVRLGTLRVEAGPQTANQATP